MSFLSQEPITEDIEQTIHNIYGQFALFVEGVEHLPSHLSPLLKNCYLNLYKSWFINSKSLTCNFIDINHYVF